VRRHLYARSNVLLSNAAYQGEERTRAFVGASGGLPEVIDLCLGAVEGNGHQSLALHAISSGGTCMKTAAEMETRKRDVGRSDRTILLSFTIFTSQLSAQ
jgi:hypothetical protein